jgi:selenocysteine lyase/cysteine desulfurase
MRPDPAAGYRAHFDLDDDIVWLNSAHQSALPRAAAEAAAEAVRWKARPWELTSERFRAVPEALRLAIGGLVGAPADEIILSNGASFGLHAIARGLSLESGDDVLVMQGDFPSNILPWLMREAEGVRVRAIAPRGAVLQADEVAAAIGPRTRAVCVSWVHSFSGHTIDLAAIGALCWASGAAFVVNVTQGVGVRALDLAMAPVDAVVASGWKWLCGPYGTGFAWVRPELLARMRCEQAYWLSMQTADDLARSGDPRLPEIYGPRQFEIFGTANFFNFKPFEASVSLLAGIGPDAAGAHIDVLVNRLVEGLVDAAYRLISPADGPARSSLVVFSHPDPDRNAGIHQKLLDARIHAAHRKGNIRISPHVYNTVDEIDRALTVLRRAGGLE